MKATFKYKKLYSITLNHDEIISSLEKRLKKMDCSVEKNIEFRNRGTIGEMDIFGVKKDYIYYIEVKTTNRPKNKKKAKEQLNKGKDFLQELYPDKRIFNFYAYSSNSPRGYYTEYISNDEPIESEEKYVEKNIEKKLNNQKIFLPKGL